MDSNAKQAAAVSISKSAVPVLPWDRYAVDENRFRILVTVFLLMFLLFALVIPNIELPKKEREQVELVPPRLAKLLMEKRQPPPPVKKPEPKPKPEEALEKPKPKPKKTVPKKTEPKKKKTKKKEPTLPKPETRQPPQQQARQQAKQQAQAAIAVFDDLADLRDQEQLAALSSQAKVHRLGVGENNNQSSRAMLTSLAAGGSGGVAVAKASRQGAGNQLAGVDSTQVKSAIKSTPVSQRPTAKAKRANARRTSKEIQRVFDRHKGSLYSLYRRALRKNPTLEGTLVLRLVIQPSGQVSHASVVSSELNDPALERKIVLKVKRINFGAKKVGVWDNTYPIAFLPS